MAMARCSLSCPDARLIRDFPYSSRCPIVSTALARALTHTLSTPRVWRLNWRRLRPDDYSCLGWRLRGYGEACGMRSGKGTGLYFRHTLANHGCCSRGRPAGR